MKRLIIILSWLILGIVFSVSAGLNVSVEEQPIEQTNTWEVQTWVVDVVKPTKPTTTVKRNLPTNITETQEVRIFWFPEESIANYVATQYYRRWDVDLLLTMLWENWAYDIYAVSPTNDYWLCQRHYDSSTDDFINRPDFHNVDVQMNECIRLRNSTKKTGRNKTKRTAYPSRRNHAWKVTIVDTESIIDENKI